MSAVVRCSDCISWLSIWGGQDGSQVRERECSDQLRTRPELLSVRLRQCCNLPISGYTQSSGHLNCFALYPKQNKTLMSERLYHINLWDASVLHDVITQVVQTVLIMSTEIITDGAENDSRKVWILITTDKELGLSVFLSFVRIWRARQTWTCWSSRPSSSPRSCACVRLWLAWSGRGMTP